MGGKARVVRVARAVTTRTTTLSTCNRVALKSKPRTSLALDFRGTWTGTCLLAMANTLIHTLLRTAIRLRLRNPLGALGPTATIPTLIGILPWPVRIHLPDRIGSLSRPRNSQHINKQ